MLKEILLLFCFFAISLAYPADDLQLTPETGGINPALAVEPNDNPKTALQDDDLNSAESHYGGWGRRGYGYGYGYGRPYYGGWGGYGGYRGYRGYGGYGGYGGWGYRRRGWGGGYGYWG